MIIWPLDWRYHIPWPGERCDICGSPRAATIQSLLLPEMWDVCPVHLISQRI